MICLKFKVNIYIILINSIIVELNKVLFKYEKTMNYSDKYELFIKKGIENIIKNMNIRGSFENIKRIKYEFNKIKYIIEKYVEDISLEELENCFGYNIINGEKIFRILKLMSIQPEACEIITKTELYKNKLEKEWFKLLPVLNSYTENILNYNSMIKGSVYIVPPKCYAGQADLESKNVKIIYGSESTNGNIKKDIIYIYHEILHNPILSYEKFNKENNQVHDFIKLISDMHLNFILNNCNYFDTNDNIEFIKIYPYWLLFVYGKSNTKKIDYMIKKELKYFNNKKYDVNKLKKYFYSVVTSNLIIEDNIISFIKNFNNSILKKDMDFYKYN